MKINSNSITRGWADPQNVASLEKGEPLVKGAFYDVSFDLEPDDQIVPVGERIGLMVFASDHGFTLWPKPGTELTLDLEGTLPAVARDARSRHARPARRGRRADVQGPVRQQGEQGPSRGQTRP